MVKNRFTQVLLRDVLFKRFLIIILPLYGASNALATSISFGDYHALLIGNENYKNLNDLETPHNDVEELQDVLKSVYGFKTTVVKKDLTSNEIIDELENFKERLTSSDNFLVYYAGHGIIRNNTGFWIGKNGKENRRGDWLSYSTITELLDVERGMKARHVLVIADSCYSGSILRDPYTPQKRKQNQTLFDYYQRLSQDISRTVMTSGGKSPVLDTALNSRHSVFAKYLLKTLRKNAGVLTVEQIKKKIKLDVFERSKRQLGNNAQVVQYAPIPGAGHEMGEFLLVPKGVVIDLKPIDDDLLIAGDTRDAKNKTSLQDFVTLTVDTNPKNAKVVVHGVGNYFDGMGVTKGNYQLEVSADGYEIEKRWVSVVNTHNKINFVLKRKRLTAGNVFQDPLKSGGLGPKMIVIPAGSFEMGDLSGDGIKDELPVHKVTIAYDFSMSETEITFNDYDKYLEATSAHKPDDEGWGRGEHPIINVSLNDVLAYSKWLSAETGKSYRLPSESEWEYAARAGTSTSYSWGDKVGKNNANCTGCRGRRNFNKTKPTKSFKKNAFGLYDMHGNVHEWVMDCYIHNYVGAPSDGSVRVDDNCAMQVLRSGSWFSRPRGLNSSSRFHYNRTDRADFIGFRLVQD